MPSITDARAICDALSRHGFDDWYQALLVAAIDGVDGDVPRAVQIADNLFLQGSDGGVGGERSDVS